MRDVLHIRVWWVCGGFTCCLCKAISQSTAPSDVYICEQPEFDPRILGLGWLQPAEQATQPAHETHAALYGAWCVGFFECGIQHTQGVLMPASI